MSRARKMPVIVAEKDPSTGEVNRIDPRDAEIAQLRSALRDAQIATSDANRLLAEAKAQRNSALDEIMLLRAQLKVAVDDGNAGWAAASSAPRPDALIGAGRQTRA